METAAHNHDSDNNNSDNNSSSSSKGDDDDRTATTAAEAHGEEEFHECEDGSDGEAGGASAAAPKAVPIADAAVQCEREHEREAQGTVPQQHTVVGSEQKEAEVAHVACQANEEDPEVADLLVEVA